MSRRGSLPKRGAVTLEVAVLVALVGLGGCAHGTGPVGSPERNKLAISVPAEKPFTYGIPVVFNEGTHPAILEKVELDGATPGVRILNQEIAGADRRYAYVSAVRTYPPRRPRLGHREPLDGYVLPPTSEKNGKAGAEIVLALATSRAGIHRFQGLRLTYRIGTQRYTTVIPNALRACAISDHQGRGVREWPQCRANREYV